MEEYLDSGRIAEVLAAEYGDDGFVITGLGHIVVRTRQQDGNSSWGYYGRIGDAETMWRLLRLANG